MNNPHVLVVDDENKSRKHLSELIALILPEASVYEANSGEAALSILEETNIELAFIDIEMPQMSGLQLMEAIKAKALNPYIVIVSAYKHFEYAQKAMELGAAGYITKPILRSRVSEMIDKFSQATETTNTEDDVIKFSTPLGICPVSLSKIIAIERRARGLLNLYTESEVFKSVRGTLLGLIPQLKEDFIYVNRQCIVKKKEIVRINPKSREITIGTAKTQYTILGSRDRLKQLLSYV